MSLITKTDEQELILSVLRKDRSASAELAKWFGIAGYGTRVLSAPAAHFAIEWMTR